jgi:hypothetical protein
MKITRLASDNKLTGKNILAALLCHLGYGLFQTDILLKFSFNNGADKV